MAGLGQKRTGHRAGFTLVELLVVTGVILVLMTLAVAFVPRTMEQQRVSRAATQVQGWLALSKQWALRDRAPRGLRLTYDTNASSPTYNRVTTLNYIEQPDDWWPGTGASMTISTTGGVTTAQLTGGTLNFAGVNFAVNNPPANTPWPVQVGDFLEFSSGSGPPTLAMIKSVGGPYSLTLNVTLTGTVKPSSFTVVRQARVRTGEAPLQLSADTAIDLFANNQFNSQPFASNAGFYDILFSPIGGVIAGGAGTDLHLWVIDTTLNTTPNQFNPPVAAPPYFDGQQVIVTIGLRSGFISAHPVDTNSGDPYSYTRDGKTSGF